jgi:glycosyltransferase involved in cell wall biosynthesis
VHPGRINAVVTCYNEELRLPYFLKHYQSIGVDRFIVIDNGSTDGSAEILDAHPLVTRLYTTKPFRDYKTIWREALCNQLFAHRWVIFPDVDELFVYPGWPDRDMHWFIRYLETSGYDAVFAPMVDMYPSEPLSECQYGPGQSFIEACPYFDVGNYRLVPQDTKRWQTPPYRLQGGARERLFHTGKNRDLTWADRILLRLFFSPKRNVAPKRKWQEWQARALERLDSCLPDDPPNMSKVPLMRWRPGTRFPGAPHRLNFQYRLAADWGALLHFKYLQDFGSKVEEAVSRQQHMGGAVFYKTYQEHMQDTATRSLMFSGSKRFTGYRSLLNAGLLRASKALRQELRLQPSRDGTSSSPLNLTKKGSR